MKTVLLLAAAVAALPALDVHPQLGLDAGNSAFTDLRLAVGLSSPATEAQAGNRTYECDPAYGPRLALQWVHGVADQDYGWALGLELTYDDHRGYVATATGTQADFGTGDTLLRSATLVAAPKLVLRPDYADYIDWAPGAMQIEIGPTLGLGVGWARIGGSPPSDPAGVLSWGVRMDLLWTTASQYQFGLSFGWEDFDCTASVDGIDEATISGNGLTGGFVFGTRL